MGMWSLVILIGLVSFSYPVVGAYCVHADSLEGKRPKDAGFSFAPELILFVVASFGLAALIDYFAVPWGRRIVGGLCVVILSALLHSSLNACRRIRSAKRRAIAGTPPNKALQLRRSISRALTSRF